MKKWFSRIRKILGATLLGVLLLVPGVITLFQFQGPRSYAVDHILSKLNDSLNGEIQVHSVRGSLLGEATVESVQIFDARKNLAAEVDTIDVSFDLLPLLRGEAIVDSLKVAGATAVVRTYPDGQLNWLTLVDEDSEDSEPSDFLIHLPKIALVDTAIIYLDEALELSDLETFSPLHDFRDTLTQLLDNADTAEGLRRQVETAFTNADRSTFEGPRAPMTAFLTEMSTEGAVLIQAARIAADFPHLHTQIDSDIIASPLPLETNEITYRAGQEAMRATIGKLELDPWLDASSLTFAMTSPDEALVVDLGLWTLETPLLLWALGNEAPATRAPFTFRGEVAINAQNVLANLDLSAPSSNAPLSAYVSLLDYTEESPRFELSLQGPDLALDHWLDGDDLPAATTSLLLHLHGQGFHPDTMDATLRLRLNDTTINDTYEISTLTTSIDYAQGIIDGRELLARTPYLDLSAQFYLDPAGTARLQARTIADESQTQNLARFSSPRSDRADLTLDAEVNFDGPLAELVDHITDLNARVDWDFRNLRAEDIRLRSSHGNLNIDLSRHETSDHELYRGTYALQVAGAGLQLPDIQLSSVTLVDEGRLTGRIPLDDPIESLTYFQNDLRFQLAALKTPDLSTDSTIGSLRLAKSPNHPRRANFTLNANVHNLQAADLSMAEITTSQVLALQFGTNLQATDAYDLVRSFALSGTSEIHLLDVDQLRTHNVHITTDLEGTLNRPRGSIQAQADSIDLGSQTILTIMFEASLDRPGEGELSLRADLDEHRSYSFSSDLQFQTTPQDIQLSDIIIASALTSWKSAPAGHLRWDGNSVHFHDFNLLSSGQSIALNGRFTPGVNQDLSLTIDDLDLAALRENFHLETYLPELTAYVSLGANLDGTALRPRLDVRTDVADLFVEKNGPFSLQLSFLYEDEIARIRSLGIQGFQQELLEMTATLPVILDLQGRLEPNIARPMEARLRLSDIDLIDFHESLPILEEFNVQGRIGGTIAASGELSDPHLNMDLALTEFQFQGELADNFVDLTDVDLHTQLQYHSRASGGDGLYLASHLAWRELTILDFLFETPLELENWLESLARDEVAPPRLQDTLLDLPLRLRLVLPELDLATIPVESLREDRLAGRVSAHLEIAGTIQNPDGTLDFTIDALGWKELRNIHLEWDSRLRSGDILFDRIAIALGNDDIFVANGSIPLPLSTFMTDEPIEDIPLDFRWQLQETPISKFSALDYDLARIQGSLAAYFTLSGTVRKPQFHARAGIFNTLLGDGNPGTIHMELQGQDNQVRFAGAACHRVDEFLNFTGQAPILLDLVELARGAAWKLPGDLDIALRGTEIDLAKNLPVQLLSEVLVDPAGTVDTYLSLHGSWEEQSIEGHFEINDGALTLPQYARRFDNIEGRFDIDDVALRITEDFSLEDGPSSASLAGYVEHENFTPGRLSLDITTSQLNVGGFGVDFPVFVDSTIDINGRLDATPGRLRVDLSDLNVVITDDWDRSLHSTELDEDIIVLDRTAGAETAADEIIDADEDSPFQIVVDLGIDRDTWIRHPNGDLNLTADLTTEVRGTMVAMSGDVDLIRGDLEFLGRRFNVQESQVSFVGSVPPNPRLQLEAHHILDRAVTQALGPPSSGEPRIIIRINGTLDQPRLEFQSDPPMNDTEILFVLMTGRPPDRSGVGQEEGVAAQALSAVGGLFVGMLQDQLAGTVPVDVLRLEPALPGTEGGRLEVGKYLTNDLFLSFRRQFGVDEDVAANVIRLEYHFLPRWMGELRYTDRNEGAINIYWDPL